MKSDGEGRARRYLASNPLAFKVRHPPRGCPVSSVSLPGSANLHRRYFRLAAFLVFRSACPTAFPRETRFTGPGGLAALHRLRPDGSAHLPRPSFIHLSMLAAKLLVLVSIGTGYLAMCGRAGCSRRLLWPWLGFSGVAKRQPGERIQVPAPLRPRLPIPAASCSGWYSEPLERGTPPLSSRTPVTPRPPQSTANPRVIASAAKQSPCSTDGDRLASLAMTRDERRCLVLH